ncbi:MAG: TniB family NTP-binding protein [Vulcanimicrobiaceae bacterium]
MSEGEAARAARVEKIRRGRWIDYTLARSVVGKLEDLMTTPKIHRMPNLLIVGETNNGKSMIINRFASAHKPKVHLAGPTSSFPVLVIQAPNVPDESRFYNAILSRVYAPFRASARVDQRQLQVVRLLDAIGVKILVIDEIHNILAGTSVKQQQFRNMIKYLGNELMIPIVGVGTQDAYFALQVDRQLENRFEPVLVPKWTMNEEYLRLLASFEQLFALEHPSNLIETSLAIKILALAEGTIGEISRLLMAAALYAIKTGTERIDVNTLEKCGYSGPADRKKRLG